MAIARYPHPDSLYSIDHQRSGYVVFHRQHGVVLDEIDCFGDAEGHISQREDYDEQREADERAAEAEYDATHPELTVVPPSPAYCFERLHDIWTIYDADGDVGSFGFDAHDKLWWVVANTCRFATAASLPTVFGGYFHHTRPDLGAVYAMFGAALPEVSAPAIVDIADAAQAAEAA